LLGWIAPAVAVLLPYAEEWSTPSLPEDVDVDPWGRVWVSCDDDSVRVYAPTGGERLFSFGGSGAGAGEFQTPYGIAFDVSGNAYICDYLGARIQKFTSEGVFLQSWPIPSNHADHVAIDVAGDVYVTGYSDFSVHKYASDGTPLLDWPGPNGSQNSGVLVVDNTVHVVQWDAPVVEQYATDGTFLGSFAASTLGGTDIEIDALGQLWVCDFNGHVVRVFATDGVPVDILGSPGPGPGEFNGAIGVAVGLDGSIYVADNGNGRIQRFGDSVEGLGEPSVTPAGRPVVLSIAPNPCRASSQINYSVPSDDRLAITLTDVAGRTVTTLADGPVTAGEHRLRFSPRDRGGREVPGGVYFVRLETTNGTSGSRVLVVGR
jgi:streptogramin lyase